MVLKRIWEAWRRFGTWMGDQVARLFLVVFYFTIAMPFGLFVRLTQDPLDVRDKNSAGWIERRTQDKMLPDAKRSY